MFNNIKNLPSFIMIYNKNKFYSKFNNLNHYFFLTNNLMLINNYSSLNFLTNNLNLFKKSIFSIFVKKNHYYRLNYILKFRKYISFYLYLNNYKFKFNSFFKFVLFNKLIKTSDKLFFNFKNFKKPSLYYNKFFYKNWNKLIGNFILPSTLDLFAKKKWTRKNKNFSFITGKFLIRNRKKMSFIIRNKKIIINNFFYLNKLTPLSNYSTLMYLIKNNINYSISRKNNYDFFLSRPYLFLNNFKIFKNLKKNSNFFLINSYKKHSRLFNSIRRFNRLNRIRNRNVFIFQNFFSVTDFLSKSNRNKNFSTIKPISNWFSIFSVKNPKPFFLNKKYQKRKTLYLWFALSSYKTRTLKKNKFLIPKHLNFIKFLKFVRLSKKIKKSNLYVKTLNILKKLPSLFFKNIIWSNNLCFLLPKFIFLNKIKHLTFKLNLFNFIWKNINIKFFKLKKIYLKRQSKQRFFHTSAIIKNLKKPFYISKTKTNFILEHYGFIFSNSSYINPSNKTNFFYNFKKNMFAFSYKNEIQKFILRKYTKTHFSNNIINLVPNSSFFKNTFFSSFQTFWSNDHFSNFILNKKSQLFSTILQNMSNKANWLYFNNQINYSLNNENDNINFNIKRVKFKPGYMTTWRDSRSILKTSLFLKIKYQYKLTNYLSKYKKFINFKTFLFMEMRLINILIKSRLFNDFSISNFFLKNNLIFLNGQLCSNPNIQIFCGDFIQLIINLKYYILYRWFLNLALKKKNKLKNVLKKKYNNSNHSDEKKKSYSLPKWILYSKNIIDDIPNFLEIDYFTLSVFILYEPFNWNDLNNYNLIEQKFSIINLYNWKYIT